MKRKVTFFWSMAKTVDLEADTEEQLDDLQDQAEVLINVNEDGEYVDGSFEAVEDDQTSA